MNILDTIRHIFTLHLCVFTTFYNNQTLQEDVRLLQKTLLLCTSGYRAYLWCEHAKFVAVRHPQMQNTLTVTVRELTKKYYQEWFQHWCSKTITSLQKQYAVRTANAYFNQPPRVQQQIWHALWCWGLYLKKHDVNLFKQWQTMYEELCEYTDGAPPNRVYLLHTNSYVSARLAYETPLEKLQLLR